jgi:transcriptional regulator with XRE-family HTH domain
MSRQSSLKDRLTKTHEGLLLWHQERSILDVTEKICELMEREGVNRAQLAKRLGKTRGYVTQLLDGTTNMTVRTISDVFTVLGYEFLANCRPLESSGAVPAQPVQAIQWTCSFGISSALPFLSSVSPTTHLEGTLL